LNVLMVASEMAPFAKTGGLADVVGSLPRALRHQGVEARVVLPHYSSINTNDRAVVSLGVIHVPFDGEVHLAEVQQLVSDDTRSGIADEATVYLLECPRCFRRPQLYGYSDDILRFGFFCRAVLEMLRNPRLLRWKPDVIHCHDWHTGLLPAYHRTALKEEPRLQDIKTAFSIHNLAYQGLAPKENLPRLGLDWSTYTVAGLEYFDMINPLKAGLVYSDALVAVSRRYAREIQTPEYGEGLEGVLKERSGVLHGIINGIDYDEWNPRQDPFIAAPYGNGGTLAGKARCKAALLERIGLQKHADKPLLGIVSRLSSQKGLDLVAEALPALVARGCTLVLLGSGDTSYLQLFNRLGKTYSDRVSTNLGAFDEELAHAIYAGADFFLMPSRYEPCGLGQMIALAYGTIPIVRATGGLADTVREWNAETRCGNGFLFEEYSATGMLQAVDRALSACGSTAWSSLVANALAEDFSWDVSALRYKELYAKLLPKK
jgi:starch synthase